MRDNILLISKFWGYWIKHRDNGGKWREITAFFSKGNCFEESLKNIENFVLKKENNLFEFDKADKYTARIEEGAEIIKAKMVEAGMGVILFDEFKNFDALKNIKGSYWFFYKGNKEILKRTENDFVSVVGSRKTPFTYANWINNHVPKDKIIVSGLANGADVMAHEIAMKNKQQIVIFPGIDIYRNPKTGIKKEITDYGISNGIILTDTFPGSNSYLSSNFLKRNKWMAQVVSETYVVYFNGISGTLGQVLEVSKRNGKIIMPKEVFVENLDFLKGHKSFKEIIEGNIYVK